MEQISIFDMLKIGVGPSSSHTLGPWRAAQRWVGLLKRKGKFKNLQKIKVTLYGSLSLTGRGHATDKAVILGLSGEDPETVNVTSIESKIDKIISNKLLPLGGEKEIQFDPISDIQFERKFLSFHPNGLTFQATSDKDIVFKETYYSIGGGFIVKKNENDSKPKVDFVYPFPIQSAKDLIRHCANEKLSISQIVIQNETIHKPKSVVKKDLLNIWDTMLESMYIGCHTEGILPGGLNVKRRAAEIYKKSTKNMDYTDHVTWLSSIKKSRINVHNFVKWISCFALSVNEVNASLGRVVTAPTNGSAGVIPAVLMYYLCFINKKASDKKIIEFLSVAGEIGSIFKKGATISAAMGGCQAEIGVSSSMAAGALTEVMGGAPEQVIVGAEIAMEHHLGLTCDPIGGLVQVPCIERNSMGAIKAVTAAQLALDGDPADTKVPLDEVINTMWQTALDMSKKYKETSKGGLAVAVNVPDC